MKALALTLLVATSALAEGPTRRFAIIVGNDSGGEGTRDLLYARDDAKKLSDILLRLGGVKKEDAFLLLDDSAGSLLESLGEVEKRATAARARGDRTALFFYYSGHAKDGALRMGGTQLPLEQLKARLAQAPADFRLAVFDACRSGSITRTKGMRRAPAFEVEADAQRAAKGLVILTSSASDEDSQESDSIGGSYFSHHLASGLLGDADKSGDGRVSLSEAYAYAYERTVADTADSAAGPQHPTFSFDLAGNGDLVLTDVIVRKEGVLLPAAAPAGAWFLVDMRGFVVAEIAKQDGVERLVALAPGRYWVKRRLADHLRIGEISVAAGEVRVLSDRDMHSADFSDDPVKGAYQTMTYTRHIGLGVTGGYNIVFDKPLEAGGYFPSAPTFGLDFMVHNAFGRGWSFGIDGAFGFTNGHLLIGGADQIAYKYSALVLGLSGICEWPEGWWVPFVGVRLAINILNREFPDSNLPAQGYQTFVPGVVLGMKIRIGKRWSFVARGRLNYLLYNVDHTRSLGSAELTGLINYEFGL
ncbi:MAG: caspase family protein [Archangiaceae bacterium]|nr:caspase family protein [Archangiaceae bacterium]